MFGYNTPVSSLHFSTSVSLYRQITLYIVTDIKDEDNKIFWMREITVNEKQTGSLTNRTIYETAEQGLYNQKNDSMRTSTCDSPSSISNRH